MPTLDGVMNSFTKPHSKSFLESFFSCNI